MKKLRKIILIISVFISLPLLSVLALIQEYQNPEFGKILGLILIADQIWIIGGIYLITSNDSPN